MIQPDTQSAVRPKSQSPSSNIRTNGLKHDYNLQSALRLREASFAYNLSRIRLFPNEKYFDSEVFGSNFCFSSVSPI